MRAPSTCTPPVSKRPVFAHRPPCSRERGDPGGGAISGAGGTEEPYRNISFFGELWPARRSASRGLTPVPAPPARWRERTRRRRTDACSSCAPASVALRMVGALTQALALRAYLASPLAHTDGSPRALEPSRFWDADGIPTTTMRFRQACFESAESGERERPSRKPSAEVGMPPSWSKQRCRRLQQATPGTTGRGQPQTPASWPAGG